jgi:tetratricopeptide (TPR) repeat protein
MRNRRAEGGRRRALFLLRPAVLGCLIALCPGGARSQEPLSPLPPPVTRGLYRSHWFDYLSAFSENEPAGEDKALDAMVRAGRKVGVRRLSDFSRTAVFLGRRAESQNHPERAERAYGAALVLDDANPDAILARLSFLVRHRRISEALKQFPASATSLLSTHEARVAIFSALGLWTGAAALAVLAGVVLSLALRHGPRVLHDLRERTARSFGPAGVIPLGLMIAGLPLFVGFGPMWLVFYWGALLWAYAEPRERVVLGAAFVAVGLVVPLGAWITEENLRQHSPLFVAAIDLEEHREDASAEDGLRQASAVFPEDPDVWFLLGTYAERSGDLERALGEYGRAMTADPADYRPILCRGNVHFTEGDYGEAIRDYLEAAKKDPKAADVFYNLSLARGEAYDFDGQGQAITAARALSASQVASWANNPTLARVVSPGYSVARARERIAAWNAQPKSRRLPGHGTAATPWRAFTSPWMYAPLAFLGLGMLFARSRRRAVASLCDRCGRAFCNSCHRYGDPPDYCDMCSRALRKEGMDIEVQAAEAAAMQRRAKRRARASRLVSLFVPGSHAFLEGRPVAGALTLFLFFFGVAMAWLDEKLFTPLSLPPAEAIRVTVMIGTALALLTWLRAQLVGRRAPSGS